MALDAQREEWLAQKCILANEVGFRAGEVGDEGWRDGGVRPLDEAQVAVFNSCEEVEDRSEEGERHAT